MTDSDDGFAARWSRLKRKRARGRDGTDDSGVTGNPGVTDPPDGSAGPDIAGGPPPAATEPGGQAAPSEEEAAPSEEEAARRAALIEQLPDIDTLDDSSDFAAFLQDGVPEALRRRALRKLWRLNPVYANLDGLNDYDDDFTDAAMVVKGMKTLYQVGKGMVLPEEETEPVEAAEAAAPVQGPEASEIQDDENNDAQAADEAADEAADAAVDVPAESPDETARAALDGETGGEVPPAVSVAPKARRESSPAHPRRPAAARRRWRRFET